MIRVQAADREPKSKEARIVFYLSCIVRYLRAQSAKEPESARWVGVLDVNIVRFVSTPNEKVFQWGVFIGRYE